MSLVSFLGIIVYSFSRKYMKGDVRYSHFFRNMLLLLLSVILMAVSDNLFLFWITLCCSNWMLAKLIVHKSSWKAAKASGRLAMQNFILGCSCIALAFVLMYLITGKSSIQYIVHHPDDSLYMAFALIMLLIGAMTQSAIWPFHRWLISSLNAPTPVSAIMHAGIVNAGGFLLARFAPLYFSMPKILNMIFIVGLITALLGSLWKLMQHDVKRMLASSTMGQMGFMFVQCGLGLFPAAMAHLCWHGMFKAYLFLASGGAAQEKRLQLGYPPRFIIFLFALAFGVFGTYVFVKVSNINWFAADTTLVLVSIVFIAGTQLALMILRDSSFKMWPLAMIVTGIMGSIYGINVYFFDFILSPLNLMQAQALNMLHIIALILLVFAWLFMVFIRYSNYAGQFPNWLLSLYVKTLNSSQPHPATITTYRKEYEYV
ncbi:MAG: proton-conducting membrane transporter [Ferruginibacter sp.]|nr:proton-conducting membrane transporter [Ferruginibacter sp.]